MTCIRSVVLVLLLVVATAKVGAQEHMGTSRIVMMPPDIRYYTVSAGGLFKKQEDWTESAVGYFSAALTTLSASAGMELTILAESAIDGNTEAHQDLFAAVGRAVTEHHISGRHLPSGKGREVSDWTLGPGLRHIVSDYGAELGLFVHYREHQSAGGRIAFAILAGAANAEVPTHAAYGYASLVDLKTGELRWFGLLSNEGMEVHDRPGAEAMARRLLDSLPGSVQ